SPSSSLPHLTYTMEENSCSLRLSSWFPWRPLRVSRPAGGRNTNGRKVRNRRLEVEQLEDRLVLSPSGPPFDFSNAFYLANGINPSLIQSRVGTATSASAFVVDNSNTNPDRNNIRIIETTGGFDRAGTPLYYTINRFV